MDCKPARMKDTSCQTRLAGLAPGQRQDCSALIEMAIIPASPGYRRPTRSTICPFASGSRIGSICFAWRIAGQPYWQSTPMALETLLQS